MKRSLLTAWLAALRSGNIGQCSEYLGCNNDRCCLGVLLDVAGVPAKVRPDDGVRIYLHNGDEDESLLPQSFANVVGMSTGGEVWDESHEESLSNLNDHGTSFADIADKIEANPLRYIRSIDEAA
jgi:hypothetical protein